MSTNRVHFIMLRHKVVVMVIPALFSEPACSAQLTKKIRHISFPNGSLKKHFQVLTMIGVKTILMKLLNEIIPYLNHNVFKNALVCYEV